MPGAPWTLRRSCSVASAAALNFGIAAAVLSNAGVAEDGTKFALRATARFAFLWFVVAFSAAPLHALWPSRFSRWLLARRRFVGAAFASAFVTHLSLILWLYRVAPVIDAERPVPLFEVVGGIAGLALVYGMGLTSFDWMAERLGRRRWQALHRWGSYYVMFVFIYCFSESFTHSFEDLVAQAIGGLHPALYYYPFLALGLAAVTLRVAAYVRSVRTAPIPMNDRGEAS